jgi:hypothetical protein
MYLRQYESIRFDGDTISEPIQIQIHVRQVCFLFPILLNVYINKTLKELKMMINRTSNSKEDN